VKNDKRKQQAAKKASPSLRSPFISLSSFLIFLFSLFSLLSFWSCDYGQLGGADQTETYEPEDAVFEERLNFLSGIWYSHYAGIGRLDGYRIRKWSDFTAADRVKAGIYFPGINIDSPIAWITRDSPGPGDYVLLYDSSVYGEQEDGTGGNDPDPSGAGGSFMGVVRAINVFNNDKNRGAIIIEYFENAEPKWLETQGLAPGEKPFYGIYYRVLDPNLVQMANAVDFTALYAGQNYYTEQETLEDAVNLNTVENEAEFINWGICIPQDREI
jgi:hypothetical protein